MRFEEVDPTEASSADAAVVSFLAAVSLEVDIERRFICKSLRTGGTAKNGVNLS